MSIFPACFNFSTILFRSFFSISFLVNSTFFSSGSLGSISFSRLSSFPKNTSSSEAQLKELSEDLPLSFLSSALDSSGLFDLLFLDFFEVFGFWTFDSDLFFKVFFFFLTFEVSASFFSYPSYLQQSPIRYLHQFQYYLHHPQFLKVPNFHLFLIILLFPLVLQIFSGSYFFSWFFYFSCYFIQFKRSFYLV